MSLERLKTRIERAQARLYEYTREHGDQCECRLIHIVEGQALFEEAKAIVKANKRCAERHAGLSSHVGFNTIVIASYSHIELDLSSDIESSHKMVALTKT